MAINQALSALGGQLSEGVNRARALGGQGLSRIGNLSAQGLSRAQGFGSRGLSALQGVGGQFNQAQDFGNRQIMQQMQEAQQQGQQGFDQGGQGMFSNPFATEEENFVNQLEQGMNPQQQGQQAQGGALSGLRSLASNPELARFGKSALMGALSGSAGGPMGMLGGALLNPTSLSALSNIAGSQFGQDSIIGQGLQGIGGGLGAYGELTNPFASQVANMGTGQGIRAIMGAFRENQAGMQSGAEGSDGSIPEEKQRELDALQSKRKHSPDTMTKEDKKRRAVLLFSKAIKAKPKNRAGILNS